MKVIDRINSDTEYLTEILSELAYEGFCNQYSYANDRECDGNCKECIKEFLNSESL